MGWRPSMTIMMPDPIRRPLRRVRIILVSLKEEHTMTLLAIIAIILYIPLGVIIKLASRY